MAPNPPPPLSPEARREATARSIAMRRAWAALKAELRAGAISIDEALERARADDVLARMRALSLIEALPGIGTAKAQRALKELGISPRRRLRGLGPRQVESLCERFLRD